MPREGGGHDLEPRPRTNAAKDVEVDQLAYVGLGRAPYLQRPPRDDILLHVACDEFDQLANAPVDDPTLFV